MNWQTLVHCTTTYVANMAGSLIFRCRWSPQVFGMKNATRAQIDAHQLALLSVAAIQDKCVNRDAAGHPC